MSQQNDHDADGSAETVRHISLLQGIFDCMPAGVAVYKAVDDGEDFVVTDFNPAAEQIDKISCKDVIGRRVADLFPGVKELGVFAALQRVWRTGKPEQCPMGRYRDNRLIGWRENTIFKLPTGNVVAIYTDQTARRRLELDRERLIAELEVRNQELDRFTYTVSHDLKSPLVTIQGFVGLLAQDLEEHNYDAANADLQRIGRAARTMQKLLESLLELSRAGHFSGPLTSVPLGEVVVEAMDMVAGRITEIDARIEVAPDLPTVVGDRMRLRQLLQNLLDNAVKFIDTSKRTEVHVGVRWDGEVPVLFVQDNGSGIDPVYHQRIFDIFDRLEESSQGTGIGLALAKRVVELHGGCLWVESEGKGRGSCFCFTLPGLQGKDCEP